MSTAISKKINHIFQLMIMLANDKELYPQDINIQDNLNVSERTLRRYLEDIHSLFSNLILTEKKKVQHVDRRIEVYRRVKNNKDYSAVLKYFVNNSNDITWVLQLIFENDPSFLTNLTNNERNNIESTLKNDSSIIEFVTPPFEHFNYEQQQIFTSLKSSVANHEYKNITYNSTKIEFLENIKCLKILYISNNWYLAIETNLQRFRLLRIAFIEEVNYSTKSTYQKSILNKYSSFLDSIQNAFTLYDTQKKKAILKIAQERAKYFQQNMKTFFPSQKFINETQDGSIIISIEFTQSLEILPFIKQWIPYIEIIEPAELIEDLKNDLTNYLQNL